ncbi:receptor protein kinase TMK1 [Selaginella moellendorffii]|nr:receptor protein kinase TMK1 [Selaginella moellendorffii]|eukprot:XP_002980850.2 receptor protein kinase TMK1 [Selaginella moellendorffii]
MERFRAGAMAGARNLWKKLLLLALLLVSLHWRCTATTNPGDLAVLQSFLQGIDQKSVLTNWKNSDPCGDRWIHIKCTGAAVTALEMNNLQLGGTVTPDINKLSSLDSLQLQQNGFTGSLPSLSGLTSLSRAYFGGNSFDTIPGDFFTGLTNVMEIFLEDNHVNSTPGWSLPADIQHCSNLQTLSITNTTLGGTIPDFLGTMSSLKNLYLAYNTLRGGIPATFAGSNLIKFQANNQQGNEPLTGSIDPVASMQSLTTLWLHVNQFSGVIPPGLGNLSSLQDLKLNDNEFVGVVPQSLTQLPALKNFTIKGNMLVGPMPELGFSYDGSTNGFCQATPGLPCDPRVTALLDFAGAADAFTSPCMTTWKGNDPCSWTGINCVRGTVTTIQLPNCQLNGSISTALANLTGLTALDLRNNHISGLLPAAIVQIPTLRNLNLFRNRLSGPLPPFPSGLQVNVDENPLTPVSPASGSGASPSGSSGTQAPGSPNAPSGAEQSTRRKVSPAAIAVPVVGAVAAVAAAVSVFVMCRRKRPRFMRVQSSSAIVVHPRDSSFERETVKLPTSVAKEGHSGPSEVRVETGNLVISIHVLRKATNGFSENSILGRGGFGVVYKGELDDGTKIAVKRMESAVVNNKGLSEFQAEIQVLTKVRHRHLVALLGYCIHGNEKLLVYEYMPQGTLSQHLFEFAKHGYHHLTWKHRLSIALDVARGIEYLHGLAHKSFIHRDLKPSNILLDDTLHAKVADFGLVKLAPEGKVSVETRLAGTFGYLAPEYAVTGRVTTKVDVYSFGVILMELITGRQALDTSRSEETMHLPTWFKRMRVNRETFRSSLDPVLEVTDEEFESICSVAELAGYCTMREPYQRPDMSHAVNVLAPMVERWKPSMDFDAEEGGIDLGLSLSEALRRWQESETGMDETRTSLPTRPPGFADSFSSTDVR